MKQVLLRLDERLKSALETAAKESGRSLNAEVANRLEASVERAPAAQLGSALAAVMAAAGQEAERLSGKPWRDDPWGYGEAVAAAQWVLTRLKPRGEVVPPKVAIEPALVDQLGEDAARAYAEMHQLRVGVRVADDFLRVGQGDVALARMRFQEALGDLAGRLHQE
jgi:hypothetical protein